MDVRQALKLRGALGAAARGSGGGSRRKSTGSTSRGKATRKPRAKATPSSNRKRAAPPTASRRAAAGRRRAAAGSSGPGRATASGRRDRGTQLTLIEGGCGASAAAGAGQLELAAPAAPVVSELEAEPATPPAVTAATPQASAARRRSSAAAGHSRGARASRSAAGGNGRRRTAAELAAGQRSISVSEFFTKNRHLLGFDNPSKALLTTVKEAADNSLDACEEAGILPDLGVAIVQLGEDRYRAIVQDNGPGIIKGQVPRIFGQLLYGSKFHTLKQARGQQGIGISAAGMYGQLTTGRPVVIVSRTDPRQPARRFEIQIDTQKNTPVIVRDEEIDWECEHGTRVEIDIQATYKRGRRSVDGYIEMTALANPHARIVYRPPVGEALRYDRVAFELPREPRAIKPHPHGVELGILMRMLSQTKSRNVKGFLQADFSRVSAKVADEIVAAAGIAPSMSPRRVHRDAAERLYQAIGKVKIMSPPTNCLSPIGEEQLLAGLRQQVDAAFYTSVTRSPAVYRGNPFQVEVGIAYGGDLPADELARVMRFANRVPLLYQPGACAVTRSVVGTSWRGYRVQQSRGALPSGPLVLMVHIASAWVPFTSESKEAIASYPEIVKEIKLALQTCGRRLAQHIGRGQRLRDAEKKQSYIQQYIPHVGIALREILGLSERQERQVVETLTGTLERSRKL